MIEAERLGLRTRRGWVFRDVDLRVPPGRVAVLTGPAGTGRTMLLLALAGRARPTEGRLAVDGETRRPAVRRLVAVARAVGAVEPDPDLTVAGARTEAALLRPGADLAAAERLVGVQVDSADVVGELPPDDQALLALAYAVSDRPAAVVLDDIDLHASPEQQRRIWTAVRAVAESGISVLATTADPSPAEAAFAGAAEELIIITLSPTAEHPVPTPVEESWPDPADPADPAADTEGDDRAGA